MGSSLAVSCRPSRCSPQILLDFAIVLSAMRSVAPRFAPRVWLRHVLDFAYPGVCACCDAPTIGGGAACEDPGRQRAAADARHRNANAPAFARQTARQRARRVRAARASRELVDG